MTKEGVPSKPLKVSASQKNGTKIEVTWQPPQYPNGLITGYELFVTPPSPPSQYSTPKTSIVINVNPRYGRNYTFYVVAKNKLYESPASATVTFQFDDAAIVDEVKDLKVEETTNNSVTLSWRKVNNAEGYIVMTRPPVPYPSLPANTTLKNSITLTPLAPGIKYIFEVSAFKKDFIGKNMMITANTNGNPLPSIANLYPHLVKSQGTTVKLTWDPPKNPPKFKWHYAIHYATKYSQLFKGFLFYNSMFV